MGLQDIVEEQDQVSSDGLTGFVGGIWRGIMSTVVGEAEPTPESALSTTLNAGPLHARLDSETERLFLCMSWWFLHVGWRILEEEVERAVGEVCKRYVGHSSVISHSKTDFMCVLVSLLRRR